MTAKAARARGVGRVMAETFLVYAPLLVGFLFKSRELRYVRRENTCHHRTECVNFFLFRARNRDTNPVYLIWSSRVMLRVVNFGIGWVSRDLEG